MNDIVRSGLGAVFISIMLAVPAAEAMAQETAAPTPPQSSPAPAQAPAAPQAPAQASAPAAAQPVYPASAGPTYAAPPGVAQPSPLLPPAPPAQAVPPPARGQAAAPSARQGREYDGPPMLFGNGKVAVGGYGGFSAGYTRMLNHDGAVVGFEGALLLAHRLSLGIAGYGFTRNPDGPMAADGSSRDFGTGYGGFVARYAFFTAFPVYPSIGLLVGGGAVALHRDDWDNRDFEDRERDDHDDVDTDGFFVAQPELSLHANLTRWMRLGLTGGYRITRGVGRFGLTEKDLNGVVLGGNIQFGWI